MGDFMLGFTSSLMKSLEDFQAKQAQEAQRDEGLRKGVFQTLLSSGNPEVQALALSGIMEKSKKNWLGQIKPSPNYDQVLKLVQRAQGGGFDGDSMGEDPMAGPKPPSVEQMAPFTSGPATTPPAMSPEMLQPPAPPAPPAGPPMGPPAGEDFGTLPPGGAPPPGGSPMPPPSAALPGRSMVAAQDQASMPPGGPPAPPPTMASASPPAPAAPQGSFSLVPPGPPPGAAPAGGRLQGLQGILQYADRQDPLGMDPQMNKLRNLVKTGIATGMPEAEIKQAIMTEMAPNSARLGAQEDIASKRAESAERQTEMREQGRSERTRLQEDSREERARKAELEREDREARREARRMLGEERKAAQAEEKTRQGEEKSRKTGKLQATRRQQDAYASVEREFNRSLDKAKADYARAVKDGAAPAEAKQAYEDAQMAAAEELDKAKSNIESRFASELEAAGNAVGPPKAPKNLDGGPPPPPASLKSSGPPLPSATSGNPDEARVQAILQKPPEQATPEELALVARYAAKLKAGR